MKTAMPLVSFVLLMAISIAGQSSSLTGDSTGEAILLSSRAGAFSGSSRATRTAPPGLRVWQQNRLNN